jgi:mannose-1-phosphate guanylyltransferase
MLHAVVMAGGSGTRFWPQSRAPRPKQFLPLASDQTLLQETVGRVDGWIPPERIWIVTNRVHAAETMRQLPALPSANLLLEPCGRNTAPCVGLAALTALARDPEATLVVMPADHAIRPATVFRTAVEQAVSIVERDSGALVLFGIRPTHPSESYGYIERAEPLLHPPGAFRVASFQEKPDRATAQRYLSAGRHYWNGGIFVWKAATILREIERFEPDIFAGLGRLHGHVGTAEWETRLAEEFPKMKSIAIDRAVLERAGNVAVLEAPFEWDDVGSWHALARLRGTDADGNTIDGPFCGIDSQRLIVQTTPDHLVATIGVSDCIVVHTPDATLVARKDDAESIRKLVEILRERGYERFA